jgi:uncharacterized protein
MKTVALVIIGLISGAVCGFAGISGSAVIVAALIYIFGYSMHLAQGTTQVLLLPSICILATWAYFKSGHVDIPVAIVMAIGFVFGRVFVAGIAAKIATSIVRKAIAFALWLIVTGIFVNTPQS